MPAPADLPSSMQELAYLNGIKVSSDADFPVHMERLITSIDGWLKRRTDHHVERESLPRKPKADAAQDTRPKRPDTLPKSDMETTIKPRVDAVISPAMLLPSPSEEAPPRKPAKTKDKSNQADMETRLWSSSALITSNTRDPGTVQLPTVFIPGKRGSPIKRLIDALEWADIPAGDVTIQKRASNLQIQEKVYRVEAFKIMRFLVTCAEFQVFVTEAYKDPAWWSFSPFAQSWHTVTPQAATPAFTGESAPREHVSWFEAMAFAGWLSAQMGVTLRLPTEQQWQRAAQGNDHRDYPWGNEWQASRANTLESKIGRTTPVEKYALGRSPFQVYDMAGNLQQWCLNDYALNTITSPAGTDKVIRGGAWKHKKVNVFARGRLAAGERVDFVGFRLVLLP
jgi:formylglycine-generating enzyme required for sulfatase activity